MKIILINNLYKPYARGGAERVVKIIADGLIEAGQEVVVVSSRPWRTLQPSRDCHASAIAMARNDSYYSWNIISYYNLGKLPKIFRPIWHLINIFNIHSYFKIKRILKREQPDLVMTHNLMGIGFLTPLVIKRLKRSGVSASSVLCKHIHTLHDIQLLHPSGLMNAGEEKKIDNMFPRVYQWINQKLFSKVDVVVSPSEWLMQMHKDRGFFLNSNRVIMHNPTTSCHSRESGNSKNYSRDSRLRGNDNKKFVFLYVGQIEKHKGVELLVEAFKKLNNQKYELQIIGDGEALGALQQECSDCLNHVKFLGRKKTEEVRELMQKSDCLVVPSLCYENQPTVIIEAMQNNLPVIASDIGGIPELLPPEFLFKAGDSESLKNKMNWIIENKQKLHATEVKLVSMEEYIDKILSL